MQHVHATSLGNLDSLSSVPNEPLVELVELPPSGFRRLDRYVSLKSRELLYDHVMCGASARLINFGQPACLA